MKVLGRSRWMVLGAFPLFWFSVNSSFGGAGSEFALLTAGNAAACAVLVARLRGSWRRTLWAWVLLVVLLDAYFFKMAWIARHVDSRRYMATFYPDLQFLTPQLMLDSYRLITVGFVVASLAMAVALSVPMHPAPEDPDPDRIDRAAALHLTSATALVFLLVALVSARTGSALLGQASTAGVPRVVDAGVNLVLQFLAPAAVLLCVWVLDIGRSRRTALAVGVLIGMGGISSAVTTSRGTLLYAALTIFFLFSVTGRLTSRRRALIGVVLAVAVVAFPVLSAARYARLSGTESRHAFPGVTAVVDSAARILARPSGADGIWQSVSYVAGNGEPRPSRFLAPRAMRNFYTHSVVGVDRLHDYRSPGILAAIFLLTGSGPAFVVLIALFVAGVRLLWGWAGGRRAAPVALALTALTLVGWWNEGTLEWQNLLKLALAVAMCDLLLRRLLLRPRHQRQEQPDMADDVMFRPGGPRTPAGRRTAPAIAGRGD